MLFDQKGLELRLYAVAGLQLIDQVHTSSEPHSLRRRSAFFLGMRYAEHGESTVNARGSGASGAEDAEENAEPERKVSPSKRDARWLQ